MMPNMLQRIGLTGGIGAGKSTVSSRFRALGAFVLDADAISRSLLEPEGGCFDAVRALFPAAMGEDGRLNRAHIAKEVFSDPHKRKALNNIVHPAVIARMHLLADEHLRIVPEGMVIFDVPLLIECGMHTDMDCVILVVADDPVRIERIIRRDGCTAEQAEARFSAQMAQDEKRRYADFIIDNSGTLEQLYDQVDSLYAGLTGTGGCG